MEPFFPQLAGPYWALVAQHKYLQLSTLSYNLLVLARLRL